MLLHKDMKVELLMEQMVLINRKVSSQLELDHKITVKKEDIMNKLIKTRFIKLLYFLQVIDFTIDNLPKVQ